MGALTTADFVCLPQLTHLILLISSLVDTARLELCVSDKGHVQWWGLQDRFEKQFLTPVILNSVLLSNTLYSDNQHVEKELQLSCI